MFDDERTAGRLVWVYLVVLIVLSPLFSAGSDSEGVPAHNSTILSSPSGIHRTYWLKGDLFFNWNGSRSSSGPLISAYDGDLVTIMLLSNDSAPHDWYLDFNNNYQVDSNEIATMSPDFLSSTLWTNFTFTALLNQPFPHGGTFTYRCRYHLSMFGNFKFFAGPVSSFTHAPSTPLAGHVVSLNGSASWPSTGASIVTYKWDFGDGNVTGSSLPSISHRYSSAGNYSATLNVTDSSSQSAASSGTITVKNVPPVPFDYAISLAPSRTSIVQGQNTTVIVRSSLVSGIAENVSLSTAVSPDPSFRIVLNTTSGFPSFSVTMLIATGSSSQIGTYTVTVMGMSSSGVARNATFTLTLTSRPPATPQTPNYAVFAGIGAVVVASVLLVFLVPRRLRNKKP